MVLVLCKGSLCDSSVTQPSRSVLSSIDIGLYIGEPVTASINILIAQLVTRNAIRVPCGYLFNELVLGLLNVTIRYR